MVKFGAMRLKTHHCLTQCKSVKHRIDRTTQSLPCFNKKNLLSIKLFDIAYLVVIAAFGTNYFVD